MGLIFVALFHLHPKMFSQCPGPSIHSEGPFDLKAWGQRKESSPQARGGHFSKEKRKQNSPKVAAERWGRGWGGTERSRGAERNWD